MDKEQQAPVFIVGAPRSGTTMLAAMMAAHPSFAAGPETHFFSKLPLAELERAAAPEKWPSEAIGLLQRLTIAGQSVVALFESDERALNGYLASEKPSIPVMLESLTVPFARRRNKPRWVEKTPNHILNVETIRRLWPAARIIRIVRDPRDVGLSTRKLPSFSDRILPNVYLWLKWHRASEAFFGRDELSLSVHYENIIDNPREELTRLCAFVGEDFDPAMLEFGAAGADVGTEAETWKKPVEGRLSKSRKHAWKKALPEEFRPICDMICHEYLQQFGYEHEYAASETRTAFRMSTRFIERNESLLLRDAGRGVRWLPAESAGSADRIVDHPRYSRFRDPVMLLRLAGGRFASATGRLIS